MTKKQPNTDDIGTLIKAVADAPALKVKHALIEYFGESVHQGFDGWTSAEAATLMKFYRDFALNLNLMEAPEQPYTIWSVDVDPTK